MASLMKTRIRFYLRRAILWVFDIGSQKHIAPEMLKKMRLISGKNWIDTETHILQSETVKGSGLRSRLFFFVCGPRLRRAFRQYTENLEKENADLLWRLNKTQDELMDYCSLYANMVEKEKAVKGEAWGA